MSSFWRRGWQTGWVKKATKIAAIGATAAVLVAGGALGMNVLAGSKSSSPPSAKVASRLHGHRHLPRGFRKFEIPGGVVVRGAVSAISSTSVTIVEHGGHSVTAEIGSATHIYGLSITTAKGEISNGNVHGLMVERHGEALRLMLRTHSGLAAGGSVA